MSVGQHVSTRTPSARKKPGWASDADSATAGGERQPYMKLALPLLDSAIHSAGMASPSRTRRINSNRHLTGAPRSHVGLALVASRRAADARRPRHLRPHAERAKETELVLER